MADLAPRFRAMLRGLSQEERKVLRQCLDECHDLAACRQLTACGLDGSEVQIPLEDNMTVEDLRKSVAGRIGLRLGGMLVLAAGGDTLDDSKPLLEQVQSDVITYVVQQVALAMLICILLLFGCKRIPCLEFFSEGLRIQPRLVQGTQQLRFCEPATANA